jgi:glycosyltransferase involved in cell wall biosynthesis
MARVLHLSSQRPSLTGSGITLDALVRHAAEAGWEQCVSIGVPAEDAAPDVGGLEADRIRPVLFGGSGSAGTGSAPGCAGSAGIESNLEFPVPGMSDVMPYESTRFRDMSPDQLDAYREAWREHVRRLVGEFRPDVAHSHHVWIMSSLLKDVAPDLPVVVHCHATGLRQMALCPHLADEVRAGCRRNDRFVVLHRAHAGELASKLGIPEERIHIVGAGYRDDLFHARGRETAGEGGRQRLLYVGKYSASKGLPWLLDAVEELASSHPALELHVAGTGSGSEAEALEKRMHALAPRVRLHGQLAQPELAVLMRRCSVCVLPSFYEGLPLVLVEAIACGCRLVATTLPGIVEQLAPHLGDDLELVPLPRLSGVDRPEADDIPEFVRSLRDAIDRSLSKDPDGSSVASLDHFTWQAVFERVERIWKELAMG